MSESELSRLAEELGYTIRQSPSADGRQNYSLIESLSEFVVIGNHINLDEIEKFLTALKVARSGP